MAWLPRNAQKCIFFTPFSPFLAKKNFFSKIRLRQFFGTIESYLDAKNQKKLWSGSSGIHPDGRTDGRTRAKLQDLPNSWVGPKMLKNSGKLGKNIEISLFCKQKCRGRIISQQRVYPKIAFFLYNIYVKITRKWHFWG